MVDRDAYFEGWARLHGGYDPRANTLVRWWLGLSHLVARPLAAGSVPPDVVTALGVLVTAGAVLAAAAGDGWWLALAALVVVVSGLLDNLDGAVALLTGRTSRWGHFLDSLADRVSDVLYLVVLLAAGAPIELCAAAGVGMFLLEYARARATVAGMTEVGVVTVFERPTRVIVTALFLLAAAVVGDPWPALGTAAWTGLGVIGLAQLTVAARRALR